MMLEIVYLKEVSTGQIVKAELHGTIPDEILAQWDEKWVPAMKAICEGRLLSDKPEDSHWNWRRKLGTANNLLKYTSYAIMCAGELQGLMLTNDVWAARHHDQFGKPTVYIEFIATAPWNRRAAGRIRYRGVGTVFLAAAIIQSRTMGFRGRVALHSLPDAENFYRGQGLTELGRDSSHQNLLYFEMTEEGARKFIKSPRES